MGWTGLPCTYLGTYLPALGPYFLAFRARGGPTSTSRPSCCTVHVPTCSPGTPPGGVVPDGGVGTRAGGTFGNRGDTGGVRALNLLCGVLTRPGRSWHAKSGRVGRAVGGVANQGRMTRSLKVQSRSLGRPAKGTRGVSVGLTSRMSFNLQDQSSRPQAGMRPPQQPAPSAALKIRGDGSRGQRGIGTVKSPTPPNSTASESRALGPTQ